MKSNSKHFQSSEIAPKCAITYLYSSKYYRGDKKLKTCQEQPRLLSAHSMKVFYKTTTCQRRPLLSCPESVHLIQV